MRRAVLDRDRAARRERGELAERVPGDALGLGAAGLLPARDARAVDRRLREAGAVVDALERVVADELGGELEQLGALRGDLLLHPGLLAPLAGEEQRGALETTHHGR
jgi:hypothetical protein